MEALPSADTSVNMGLEHTHAIDPTSGIRRCTHDRNHIEPIRQNAGPG